MRVLLLGPVVVLHDGRELDPGSVKQSALITALARHAGASMSDRWLTGILWDGNPPATARNTLQAHVSAVRRSLGRDSVVRTGDGYRLDIEPTDVDAAEFAEGLRQGSDHLDAGDAASAARVLRSALALWRDIPFPSLEGAWFASERQRLVRLHDRARKLRLEADLRLGRHRLVLDELTALRAGNSLDEDIAAKLMLALYRSGQQAEALTVFEEIRSELALHLGLDPGAELRELHMRVLQQDPALGQPGADTVQVPWLPPAVLESHTTLIGREPLVQSLIPRVEPGSLVTLVGPEGTGKSRLVKELVLRLQGRYRLGVVVLFPDTMTTWERVCTEVTRQCEEVPAGEHAVEQALRSDGLLVVVDGVDAEWPVAEQVERLRSAGARSTWLLTSPRPTGLRGEEVVPIPPLAAGTPAEPGPGVRLLLERARASGADLTEDRTNLTLACRCVELLGGLPQAIELAAPAAVLGLEELMARLSPDSSGGDLVQMSFTGSLSLLEPVERELLDAMSLCGHPADADFLASLLPAAAGVARSDTWAALAALVRDGLVRRLPGTHGPVQFALPPAIGRVVRQQMSAERRFTLADRMVSQAALSFRPASEFVGLALPTAEHARRLGAHSGVLESAFAFAREVDRPECGAELGILLVTLHFAGSGVDQPGRLEWLLEDERVDPRRRVALHFCAGGVARASYQAEQMRYHLDRAATLAAEIGDDAGLALCLSYRRMAEAILGGPDPGTRDRERAFGEDAPEAVRAAVLCWSGAADGDPVTLRESVRLARKAGHHGIQLLALANLADILLEQGYAEAARPHALEAGSLALEAHHVMLAGAMAGTKETIDAITGRPGGLRGQAQALRRTWDAESIQLAGDALLKLAAGAHAIGETDLARECLAAYESVLVRTQSGDSVWGRVFREVYLGASYEDVEASYSVSHSVDRIVAAFDRV